MSNDPKDPPQPPAELFPFDEMSTGETSSLLRRANVVTGKPANPTPQPQDPTLRPMTGAQLAFRPSAPTRPGTGTHPALKPGTGTQPAFKPSTGTQPAFKPATGTQPAFKPTTGPQPAFKPTTGTQPAFRPGSGSHAAVRPAPSAPQPPPREEEPPQFDAERLQAQFRHLSLTDSALGRAAAQSKAGQKVAPKPSSAVEDTFVKRKMKQAEDKVPDFDLDDDLG
jgi:hypothetical protein